MYLQKEKKKSLLTKKKKFNFKCFTKEKVSQDFETFPQFEAKIVRNIIT